MIKNSYMCYEYMIELSLAKVNAYSAVYKSAAGFSEKKP